ncbi:hypothetical protein PsorP6_007975 [Peronosclerospora sorghi]|uniref:Uncharacterized protein n=1 Tax=Peronosclerospora sorghi TaxID=230839 RepID=A0ACC0WD15_9STRA|nr:hypothetical protein PsorP6_007975 [Peronosclerospora sorghi]
MSIIQHRTSSSSFSNAIVSVQDLSNEFTTEEKGRVSKRLRIVYEQAYTAYEIPTSYDDALKSPQETMWRKAIQIELNACIFIKQVNKSWVYVTLYVDDLLIGAKTFEVIQDIAAEIGKKFNLKVLGSVRFILGSEVDYDQEKRHLKMSQGTYIQRMMEKYNQDDTKPVYNPVVEGQFLTKNEDKDPKTENRPYRSLVGSLLYFTTGTRPDIAFAVFQLSRHLEQPCEEQSKAEIRVLKYLKSTKRISQNITIEAYSDADWAGNRDNRRSTSDVVTMVNGAPVIFKRKLQQSVALSTKEAEYMALSLCLQEILWIKSLSNEFKIKIDYPIPIYEDNQSAIAIAKKNGYVVKRAIIRPN